MGFWIFGKQTTDFFDFFRYGSWRPLDVSKTLSEDVRTFSTIGQLILGTSLFRPFLSPPPSPHLLATWTHNYIAVKTYEKCKSYIKMLILRCVYEGDLNVDCIFTGNSAPRQRDGIHTGTIAPALATPPEPLRASSVWGIIQYIDPCVYG